MKKVFSRVLDADASVFFFPDGNMGRNISRDLGLSDADLCVWDEQQGLRAHGAKKAKVFLWEGFCIVHRAMTASDVLKARKAHEGVKVIVHPECPPEVYNLADFAGSTNVIKNSIEKSESGSKWAVGTERNFVNRIARENADKLVVPLRQEECRNMAKVTPQKLLSVLEGLLRGELPGRVSLGEPISRQAATALERMLEIS